MTALAALTVLVLVLATRGRPGPESRTPAQLWAAVRRLGWRTATWRGVAGLIVVTCLIAGALAIATIGATLRTLAWVSLLLTTIAWHIATLIGWHPITLREAS